MARPAHPARLLALAAALLLPLACAHTHHVGQGQSEEGTSGGEKKEQGASPRASKTRVPPRSGRPAVAASPEQLMNPGSARRIQEALRAKGYLGTVSGQLDTPTAAALRRFQRDQDLAQTGAPDRETLSKLGVDPQQVYRTVPQGSENKPAG